MPKMKQVTDTKQRKENPPAPRLIRWEVGDPAEDDFREEDGLITGFDDFESSFSDMDFGDS